MFTLQGRYYKKMIRSVLIGFTDLVIIGERIENALKSGKIRKSSSSQHNNKRYPNNNNLKKGDVNVITMDEYSQVPYNPYVARINPNQYPQPHTSSLKLNSIGHRLRKINNKMGIPEGINKVLGSMLTLYL